MAEVAVTTSQIMDLRKRTGAGMMDCKKALIEANGDMEKAIEILRKKGLSGLAKRAERQTNEGVVVIKNKENLYAMVEMNCETDFVARNDEFVNLANSLADEMLENSNFDPVTDERAKERLNSIAIKIGENMLIRRGVLVKEDENTIVNYYLHSDNKKGCIVKLGYEGNASDLNKLKEVAKNLAMQAVAMTPKWIKKEDVPIEVIEKEKEIYKSSPQAQGKSEIALNKMLEGRITKFYREVCLLEQDYIRDQSINVARYIENISKEINSNIKVLSFDLFIVGME